MKLPYTAKCRMSADDQIIVEDADDDGDIRIRGSHDNSFTHSLFLRPAEARKLAKALKKAAKNAERAK